MLFFKLLSIVLTLFFFVFYQSSLFVGYCGLLINQGFKFIFSLFVCCELIDLLNKLLEFFYQSVLYCLTA
jgi:hypothetical protein